MNGYLDDASMGDGIADYVTLPRLGSRSGVLGGIALARRTRGSVPRVRLARRLFRPLAVLAVPAAGGTLGDQRSRRLPGRDLRARPRHPTAMAYGPGRADLRDPGPAARSSRSGAARARRACSCPACGRRSGWPGSGSTLFVSRAGPARAVRLRGGRLRGPARARSRACPSAATSRTTSWSLRTGGSTGAAARPVTCAVSGPAQRDRSSRSARTARDLRVVARGLRNPYGLAFHPGTGRLYATVNGQDEIGTPSDPEPAEMLVVVRRGAFYGWPRCWPNARTLRLSGRAAASTAPAAYLEPHSSADGLAFYTAPQLPARLRRQRLRRRVGRVPEQPLRPAGRPRTAGAGRPRPARERLRPGFDHPLALLVDPGGGLLVADWGRGVVYRIQARGRS